jgi:hypothetical protein
MELILPAEWRVVLLEGLSFPFAHEMPVLRAADPSRRETTNATSMSSGSQDADLGRAASAEGFQTLQCPQLAATSQIDAFGSPLASAQSRDKDQETSAV